MATSNVQDNKASSSSAFTVHGYTSPSTAVLTSALRKTDSGARSADADNNAGRVKLPRKSVSFPKLAGEESAQMPSSSDRHQVEDHESSADEHTGMLSARRDSGRDYSAVDSPSLGSSGATGFEGVTRVPVNKRNAQKARRNSTEETKRGWLTTLLGKYGSVELENGGSVARDHLALERTFLAWLRTSLSFASIGIAITQLFRLNTSIGPIDPQQPTLNHLRRVGKPLGASFIAIAIIILFFGFHRYFESQHYIIRGKFPASRGSIFIVALMAFALSVASLVVVVVIGGSNLGAEDGK